MDDESGSDDSDDDSNDTNTAQETTAGLAVLNGRVPFRGKPRSEDKPKVEKVSKSRKTVEVNLSGLTNGEAEKKWQELHEKLGAEEALPYSISSQYESKMPLLHKVLGWGYILNIQNDRLEVLFKDGIKMLISNYQK
jgi:hypothetical protein